MREERGEEGRDTIIFITIFFGRKLHSVHLFSCSILDLFFCLFFFFLFCFCSSLSGSNSLTYSPSLKLVKIRSFLSLPLSLYLCLYVLFSLLSSLCLPLSLLSLFTLSHPLPYTITFKSLIPIGSSDGMMSSSGIGPGMAELVGRPCRAARRCNSAAVPPNKSNSLAVVNSLPKNKVNKMHNI
jgi:hypothetical protein